MKTPLVSIITVNYHQTNITCELLQSLQKISYKNIEIWVVDNDSDGELKNEIERNFANVHIIESKENLGFAGGNNLAIKQAKGDLLMFLNNDTEVTPHFLEPLIKTMLSNSTIGICTSKIHFFHTPNVLQFAGSSPLHPLKIQSFAIGYGLKDEGQFDQVCKTHLAHGAAMMVRSKVVKEVGLMPEEYFLYYEEIDWCEQIKEAGYSIYFVPESLVLHKESMSVGKQSPIQVYYKTRNRILLARRRLKGFQKIKSLSYLSLVAVRDISKLAIERKSLLLQKYIDALIWHIKH